MGGVLHKGMGRYNSRTIGKLDSLAAKQLGNYLELLLSYLFSTWHGSRCLKHFFAQSKLHSCAEQLSSWVFKLLVQIVDVTDKH